MKAVNSFRSRIRTGSGNSSSSSPPSSAVRTLAAGGTGADGSAAAAAAAQASLISPTLAGIASPKKRAWAVVPRKLRGLHPAPMIVYVRENPELITQAMDRLYDTLVSAYGVDSKDIKVTDVPTAFDLPNAVRKMGKGKQVIVVVGLLTRDKPWFDESQVSRVRDFLLAWSQQNGIPLIDGILVDENVAQLEGRIASPQWNVRASDEIGTMNFPTSVLEPLDQSAFTDSEEAGTAVRRSNDQSSISSKDAVDGISGDYMFGHYLAHRAMEMFYFEHRGW
ncbi:hypothetical protein DL89DRAFT_267092 [Linderina pennispora]|uniref:6,7-dimethyl-8-ribityllumazine synthase n=1 Tax=Linderina pennispora TaxID=61395 RepID=A0A1Y1WBT3_9FUNG|nr:uncharacterized protein DL89DRAFT_267092 [Linderina pennispora]ORX70999.1 hypothetical protein DL89DRAFT_267092 [Linderina pennispora]